MEIIFQTRKLRPIFSDTVTEYWKIGIEYLIVIKTDLLIENGSEVGEIRLRKYRVCISNTEEEHSRKCLQLIIWKNPAKKTPWYKDHQPNNVVMV